MPGRGPVKCSGRLPTEGSWPDAQADVWEFSNPPEGPFAATLRFTAENGKPGVRVFFKDVCGLGGCWNVAPQMETGLFLPLTEKIDAEEIAVVSKERAYFYDEKSKQPKKSYVVYGDAVSLVKSEGPWVTARFNETQGLLRREDLFDLPSLKKSAAPAEAPR